MCKLAFMKTDDGTSYKRCVNMIKFQENVCAGQSSGFVFLDSGNSFRMRKAIGKVNSFLVKYPDFPSTNDCLGHSRFASVGSINLDNQHPIPLIVGGKTIGYGVHNGTFHEYTDYEYLRGEMKNKTDSALLFTMYGKMLERIGDNRLNRRIAFGYIMGLLKKHSIHNLILLFRDRSVLFSGDYLTFKKSEDGIGIMTFGLPDKCDDEFVYEVTPKKEILKFKNFWRPPFSFEPKPPTAKHEKPKRQTKVYDYPDISKWWAE